MTSPNTIIADMQAEIDALRKERDELLIALEPFSKLLQEHHSRLPNNQPIYGIGDCLITVRNMRMAAQAITKANGGK